MAQKKKGANSFSNRMSAAAEKMDIPVSALIKTARISIDGNRQMILEGHEGILEYSDELIRINCKNMILSVEGQNLLVRAMNPEGLSFTGSIKKIEFSV